MLVILWLVMAVVQSIVLKWKRGLRQAAELTLLIFCQLDVKVHQGAFVALAEYAVRVGSCKQRFEQCLHIEVVSPLLNYAFLGCREVVFTLEVSRVGAVDYHLFLGTSS